MFDKSQSATIPPARRNVGKRNRRIKIIDPETDRALLVRARRKLHGRPDEAYIDWCYYQNPAGRVHGAVALDGDVVAGQYMMIPMDLYVNGSTFKAGYILDVVSRPDYRRQGIFTDLAEALHAHVPDEVIPVSVAFPTKMSRPGFLDRLGFMEPLKIVNMFKFLRLKAGGRHYFRRAMPLTPFGWAFNLYKSRSDMDVKITDEPEAEWIEALWLACRQRVTAAPLKNGEWTRWRYRGHPKNRYGFVTGTAKDGWPLGYVVYRKNIQKTYLGFKLATIVDVFGLDLVSCTILLQAALEKLARKVDMVKSFTAIRTMHFYALCLNGFLPFNSQSFVLGKHLSSFKVKPLLERGAWDVNAAYKITL